MRGDRHVVSTPDFARAILAIDALQLILADPGWPVCALTSPELGPTQCNNQVRTGTISAAYYGSTPPAPNVRVSRYSNAVNQRFEVYSNASSCYNLGMGTEWYLGTGAQYVGRNRGTGATISDYWSSPGTRTYYGQIKCIDGSGHAGLSSGSGSASVNVYTPAPTAPTWAAISGGSRGNVIVSAQIKGVGLNYATVSAGGSSYASGYRSQMNVATASGTTGWRSDVSCTAYAASVQGRAEAYGPGGVSPGWTYSPSKAISGFSRDNGGGCWGN